MKVADVVESKTANDSLAQIIHTIIENEPSLVCDVAIITNDLIELNTYHLVIAYDVVERLNATMILANLKTSIREDGFILLEENIVGYDKSKANLIFASLNLTIVSVQRSTTKKYILLRRIFDVATRNKTVVMLTEENFDWLEQLKVALATAERENRYVYVVGQGEECLGAVGLMNCIRNEMGGKRARLVFVQDANVEKFSFASEMYVDQLKMDLISNVYKNGDWGTYRHLKLDESDVNGKASIEHAHLDVLTRGDQSSLSWIESQSLDTEDDRMELCTVYYAPINMLDVIMSNGQMAPKDGHFGLEFAGRDSNGRRKFLCLKFVSITSFLSCFRKFYRNYGIGAREIIGHHMYCPAQINLGSSE